MQTPCLFFNLRVIAHLVILHPRARCMCVCTYTSQRKQEIKHDFASHSFFFTHSRNNLKAVSDIQESAKEGAVLNSFVRFLSACITHAGTNSTTRHLRQTAHYYFPLVSDLTPEDINVMNYSARDTCGILVSTVILHLASLPPSPVPLAHGRR